MAADGLVSGPAPFGPLEVTATEADRARDLERWVVGALLCDPSALPLALDEGLRPEHLGDAGLALVYRALVRCDELGAGCDVPALLDALLTLGGGRAPFDRAWCMDALGTLGAEIPTTAYLAQHVRGVLRWARVRRVVSALRPLAAALPASSQDAEGWVERVAAAVLSAAAPEGTAGRVALGDAVAELVDRRLSVEVSPVDARRVPLPWVGAQRLLGGLGPGQLVLIAARPGAGKSAAALQIALEAATLGTVLFASLEMTRDELAARAVSVLAEVPGDVTSGRRPPTESEAADLLRAANAAGALALEVVDAASQTVAQLRARARQIAARGRLALVVVDYLQLVTPERPQETREREVAQIARSLKALAMELGVPVLALSQLSRQADGVEPRLSHLRESGALEQDANTVVFLHRKGDGSEDAEAVAMDLIVAKQRSGGTGRVPLVFRRALTTFADAVTADPEPLYEVGGWEGSGVASRAPEEGW